MAQFLKREGTLQYGEDPWYCLAGECSHEM
jgi:hypothetical protein